MKLSCPVSPCVLGPNRVGQSCVLEIFEMTLIAQKVSSWIDRAVRRGREEGKGERGGGGWGEGGSSACRILYLLKTLSIILKERG